MYMRNQLLRDTDWASMAHSLEVRVPLVDTQLMSHIAVMAVRNSRTQNGCSDKVLAMLFRPMFSIAAKTGFQTPIQTGSNAIIACRNGVAFQR